MRFKKGEIRLANLGKKNREDLGVNRKNLRPEL
jgi:hypothetical protein